MKDNKRDTRNVIKRDAANAPKKKNRIVLKSGLIMLGIAVIGLVVWVLTPYQATESMDKYLADTSQIAELPNKSVELDALSVEEGSGINGFSKDVMADAVELNSSSNGAEAEKILVPQNVTVTIDDDGHIVLQPEKAYAGMIFYPGGRVKYDAYIPLMYKLAERGFTCVIVKMPLNFAVLDINGADGITEKYSGIDRWFIGGHSLGGAMAAKYVAEHAEKYEGLMLLGAYSVDDLTETELKVFLAYGTQDGVINRNSYDKNLQKLPMGSRELIIVGGCHAYFGDYGKQLGDGHPYITREEQMDYTIDAFVEYVNSAD